MSAKLTDSQNTMLRAASLRDDRCLELPPTLKGGATQKVAGKLVAEGLVKEIKVKGEMLVWRRDKESGHAFALKLTASAVKAIALHVPVVTEPTVAPVDPADPGPNPSNSPHTIIPVPNIAKGAPREGSKLALVMSLLRRSEGATILTLTEATGWLPHTTRAALTGVRKRGYAVVLERGDEGDSVYRLAEPLQEPTVSEAESEQIAAPSRRKAAAKRAA
jgi:hypothetical protein